MWGSVSRIQQCNPVGKLHHGLMSLPCQMGSVSVLSDPSLDSFDNYPPRSSLSCRFLFSVPFCCQSFLLPITSEFICRAAFPHSIFPSQMTLSVCRAPVHPQRGHIHRPFPVAVPPADPSLIIRSPPLTAAATVSAVSVDSSCFAENVHAPSTCVSPPSSFSATIFSIYLSRSNGGRTCSSPGASSASAGARAPCVPFSYLDGLAFFLFFLF